MNPFDSACNEFYSAWNEFYSESSSLVSEWNSFHLDSNRFDARYDELQMKWHRFSVGSNSFLPECNRVLPAGQIMYSRHDMTAPMEARRPNSVAQPATTLRCRLHRS